MARGRRLPGRRGRATAAALTYIKIGLGPAAFAACSRSALRKGMSLMEAVDEIERRTAGPCRGVPAPRRPADGGAHPAARRDRAQAAARRLRPSGAHRRVDADRGGGRPMSRAACSTRCPRRSSTASARASDPARSVWVTANAGSGKTYVLTARVLRLLLSGVRAGGDPLPHLHQGGGGRDARPRRRAARPNGRCWPSGAGAGARRARPAAPPTPRDAAARPHAVRACARNAGRAARSRPSTPSARACCTAFRSEAGVPFDFTVLEDIERDAHAAARRARRCSRRACAAGRRPRRSRRCSACSAISRSRRRSIEALGRAARRCARCWPHRRRAPSANLRRLRGGPGALRDDVLTEIVAGYGLDAPTDHAAIFALAAARPGMATAFVDRLARIDPERPDVEALCRGLS